MKRAFHLSFLYWCLLGFAALVQIGLTLSLLSGTKYSSLTFTTIIKAGIVWCIIFSPFIFIMWGLYKNGTTQFTDDGIVQSGILRKTRMLWTEVVDIKKSLFALYIQLHNEKTITIYLMVYKNPEEVIEFISQKINQQSI